MSPKRSAAGRNDAGGISSLFSRNMRIKISNWTMMLVFKSRIG